MKVVVGTQDSRTRSARHHDASVAERVSSAFDPRKWQNDDHTVGILVSIVVVLHAYSYTKPDRLLVRGLQLLGIISLRQLHNLREPGVLREVELELFFQGPSRFPLLAHARV